MARAICTVIASDPPPADVTNASGVAFRARNAKAAPVASVSSGIPMGPNPYAIAPAAVFAVGERNRLPSFKAGPSKRCAPNLPVTLS